MAVKKITMKRMNIMLMRMEKWKYNWLKLEIMKENRKRRNSNLIYLSRLHIRYAFAFIYWTFLFKTLWCFNQVPPFHLTGSSNRPSAILRLPGGIFVICSRDPFDMQTQQGHFFILLNCKKFRTDWLWIIFIVVPNAW